MNGRVENNRLPYTGPESGTQPIVNAIYVNKGDQTVTIEFVSNDFDGQQYIFEEDASLRPQNGYPEGSGVVKSIVRAGTYQIQGNRAVVPAVIE